MSDCRDDAYEFLQSEIDACCKSMDEYNKQQDDLNSQRAELERRILNLKDVKNLLFQAAMETKVASGDEYVASVSKVNGVRYPPKPIPSKFYPPVAGP